MPTAVNGVTLGRRELQWIHVGLRELRDEFRQRGDHEKAVDAIEETINLVHTAFSIAECDECGVVYEHEDTLTRDIHCSSCGALQWRALVDPVVEADERLRKAKQYVDSLKDTPAPHAIKWEAQKALAQARADLEKAKENR